MELESFTVIVKMCVEMGVNVQSNSVFIVAILDLIKCTLSFKMCINYGIRSNLRT